MSEWCISGTLFLGFSYLKKVSKDLLSIIDRVVTEDKKRTADGVSLRWRRVQTVEKAKKPAKNSDQLVMF